LIFGGVEEGHLYPAPLTGRLVPGVAEEEHLRKRITATDIQLMLLDVVGAASADTTPNERLGSSFAFHQGES
jgi:hypothetical protein